MPLKLNYDDPPSLNLTSMIDVLFLLIIFFMVGTKFNEMEQTLQLELPKISEDTNPTQDSPRALMINVYRDGSVAVDDELISTEQLRPWLDEARQRNPDVGVVVRGDADGPLQNVANVLGICQGAGISDLGIHVRIARKDGE